MNLIYILTIDHPSSVHKCSDYSQFCVNTWKYWCDKHGVDLITETKSDSRFGNPKWNKLCITDVGKDYDKIGIIDSDTMVKWNAPNIFELYDEEFCGVSDNSNLRWLNDSLNVYGKFFPNVAIDYYEYINSGVMFFNKEHLSFFETILEFYTSNKKELDGWNKGGGCDQTIINYLLVKEGINKRLLSPDWNLLHINRKEMFRHNWQLNEDDTPLFMKYSNVWHFTGFPVTDRINIMKQVWTKYRGYYE
jgi:lipopolysaccharide biosynthesis glycosyltransferase